MKEKIKRPWLLFVAVIGTSFGTFAQTVQLILVSEVEEAEFGMISLQDEEKMVGLFRSAEWGFGYKLQTTYLNRANFTAEAVRKTINALPAQPDDILVFFYSGPGYYPANSTGEFPFFQLKDWKTKPLSLEETGALLKAKGTRFCLAMADCRHQSLILEPRKVPNIAAQTIARPDYGKLALHYLFLKNCGLMTVASAARSQQALVVTTSEVDDKTGVELSRETGSAFTRLFYNLIDRLNANTDLTNLEAVSFEAVLGQVQASMPLLLNPTPTTHRAQTVVWKTQPCDAAVQAKITEFPSFVYPRNLKELEHTLNHLLTLQDNDQRRLLISLLSAGFEYNLVIMQNEQNQSFNNYLNTLAIFNKKLKKIEIANTSFREDDLSAFMGVVRLKIFEIREP